MISNDSSFRRTCNHRVRDLINEGIIKIDSCCDPEQTADILTKALHHFKHQKHIAEMGMKSMLEPEYVVAFPYPSREVF